ncbi:sensor histidine kinase [Oceanobacillus manasiensis]|uniref:sensor histidine kinase n=1 Tax=Oceanobacillus manasiensis TaxID=586413 RepID=UPI0005AA62CF|nr:sensor histidine kinase [Oceanobacillus manasiensis]
MKHFLKDSIPFTLFFLSQCLLIIGIVQLYLYIIGTTLRWDVAIYLLILPLICLLLFLCFRFFKFKAYYTILSKDDAVNEMPSPPNNLLSIVKRQHEMQTNQYVSEVEQLKHQKEMEFHFIQQWIHQMKTPVSVMHLTMQKEKYNLPEDFHQSMQEELERLQQGLDLALYQSRLQKFDRDFHVERVSLKEIVRDVIKDFKSSFIRNQVFPDLTIDESIIVTTDKKWFRFVISQILTNAIKYSKDDSDKIHFTSDVSFGKTVLKISDTGYGIPPQDISRVFDPFFTGLNGREHRESTGMGLYLSKEICNALDHDLSITSKVDQETTVTITFR